MDWYSLILPIAYLTILIGSLTTFSYLFRRRQTQKALSLQPWFPTHTTRQIYLSLLELQSSPDSDTKIPDSVIRAALLRRAVTDIHRLISLRSNKQALAQLLQRGSVGDELWQRFQVAEKEMEAELREVVEEANALAQGWGQTIFQSANEIALNELLRKKIKNIDEKREAEKERWVKTREGIQQGFMKELETEEKSESKKSVKPEGKAEQVADVKTEETVQTAPETPRPTFSSASAANSVQKNGSSDDDGVLVDLEPNAPDTPGSADRKGSVDGGSAKKKKKGKK